ncbi:unnamed protein product [Diabrotica balteata]|uniref:Uncharacterized protein n=1 Tax=Diabrotica balteata TaxID=107213 RepID=A0A9N9X6P7_DIABA|nr:unnamed protein product [Diabrotica balteata]
MAALKLNITRSKVECPIFGNPVDLNCHVLPTIEYVLRCYLFIRYELKFTKYFGKEPSFNEVCEVLVPKIKSIWESASIPTVSKDRIMQLLRKYHNKYLNLIRYPKSKRNVQYELKITSFKEETRDKLFDIAACKCDFSACKYCKCDKSRKVPKQEQEFLLDQRSTRDMAIGTVDRETTKKLNVRTERQTKETERVQKFKSEFHNISMPSCSTEVTRLSTDSDNSSSSEASPSVANIDLPSKPSCSQMRIELPTLGTICDKYGISDRSAAAVATAVLKDVGIICDSDTSKVIDKNKVRRARQKNRNILSNEFQSTNKPIKSIYFDGRKDKTLVQEKKGERYHKRTIAEEHVSLIEEPNSVYLGHVTPSAGSAKSIGKAIIDFLISNNFCLDNLVAIGCDGTIVNTGHKNGVITYIENELKRPLQWFVCALHANELPLRHLFQRLDGATTGPRQFSGVIGKLLEKCEHLPIVDFEIIESDLPELTIPSKELSSDQSYLYDICQAISNGNVYENLANRSPGKLAHSRWLTMANRVLRLYVGTEHPTSRLKDLVQFIIKVYAPMWFFIKLNPSCTQASLHVFKSITLSRYLRDDLKNIIDAVIQRNSYYIHPENLLLCMLTDNRQWVRELALRRIIKARKEKKVGIRQFKIPEINFNAAEYFELINWSECEVTAPPMLADIPDDELKQLIDSSIIADFDFPKYPCHTQAVERCVKLVSESSLLVTGPERRDGFIRSKIKSKDFLVTYDNKAQFKIE